MANNQSAWSLPKGSIRAILALLFTFGIAYLWITKGVAPPAFFDLVAGIWALYFGQKALSTLVKGEAQPPYPLWLPKATVRSIIAVTVVLVAVYLWVTKGEVDPQILKGAGIVVGFYFLQHGAKAIHEAKNKSKTPSKK